MKTLERQVLQPPGPGLVAKLRDNLRCGRMMRGCVLAPALFCIAIDWILSHMASTPRIKVGCSHFSDLVYAEDAVYLLGSADDAVINFSSFNGTASTLGLQTSLPKTTLQNLVTGAQPPTIMVDGEPVSSGISQRTELTGLRTDFVSHVITMQ